MKTTTLRLVMVLLSAGLLKRGACRWQDSHDQGLRHDGHPGPGLG